MKKADIVIIGGGVIGVSIAFYLAKKKCSNVILLERNSLLGAETTTAAAGLYANTSDKCAILGEYPKLKGSYLACGFSGHGLMHAPAVGKVMAELIVDGKASTLDIYPFTIDAFKTNNRPKEKEII